MKNIIFLFVSAAIILCYSCSSDINSAQLTYTKATAIYGEVDAHRNLPLKEVTRPISDPGKVYVSEELLLIGDEGEGIHVYDNSDVENPIPLNFIRVPNNKEFFVKDNFIYAESFYDMLKIDISDKNNPQLHSRVENAFARDLVNDQGQTLIGFDIEEVTEDVEEGTRIWDEIRSNDHRVFFDFRDRVIPSSLVPTSFTGSSHSSIGTVNRIAHSEGHVYVVSNSFLTVLADKDKLEFVSSEQVGWDMETIFPQEKSLFVGTRNSVEIFSIEDPSNPQHISRFSHAISCDPVLPDGEVAYITLRTNNTGCPGDINALLVLDISNENRIDELQEINMLSPFGLTKIGDILYVGEGENGLKSFDASSRDNLSLINFDPNIKAYDVIAHPTRSDIILLASPNGFEQYRVDGPQDFTLLSVIQI